MSADPSSSTNPITNPSTVPSDGRSSDVSDQTVLWELVHSVAPSNTNHTGTIQHELDWGAIEACADIPPGGESRLNPAMRIQQADGKACARVSWALVGRPRRMGQDQRFPEADGEAEGFPHHLGSDCWIRRVQ
jgi:hypothetical protein